MSDFAIWQPWLITGLLAVVVLWYVWRSLFGDRARHGPRCLKCGHPFSESQRLTCVECGWTARRETDLTKPRRHWVQATLGILVLLGGASLLRMRTMGENPMHYVPDAVLVGVLPAVVGVANGDLFLDEVTRRLRTGELDASSRATLVTQLLAGDRTARPVNSTWRVRYGPLLDRWRRRYASPAEPMTARLLRLPADASVATPAFWPSDEPVPASLTLEDWWPPGTETIVDLGWTATPDDPPFHSVGYRNDSSIARRHHLIMPPADSWPDPPLVSVTFRAPRLVRLGGMTIPAETVPELEGGDATGTLEVAPPSPPPPVELQPWPGSDLCDTAIREMFRPGLRRWPEAETRPFAMQFSSTQLGRDEFQDVLFGLVVELIEHPPNGAPRIRRRTRIWAPGGAVETSGRRVAWDISEENTNALARAFDPDSTSTWRIRVSGDESIARRGLGLLTDEKSVAAYGRWWSGSVTFRLRTRTEEGPPFRRMWFVPGGVASPTSTPRP